MTGNGKYREIPIGKYPGRNPRIKSYDEPSVLNRVLFLVCQIDWRSGTSPVTGILLSLDGYFENIIFDPKNSGRLPMMSREMLFRFPIFWNMFLI